MILILYAIKNHPAYLLQKCDESIPCMKHMFNLHHENRITAMFSHLCSSQVVLILCRQNCAGVINDYGQWSMSCTVYQPDEVDKSRQWKLIVDKLTRFSRCCPTERPQTEQFYHQLFCRTCTTTMLSTGKRILCPVPEFFLLFLVEYFTFPHFSLVV
jgi:hypothetical protein